MPWSLYVINMMPLSKVRQKGSLKIKNAISKTLSGRFSYALLRSARRRTIEIAVTEDAQVRVRAPVYASGQVIEHFLRERSSWIEARLSEARSANRFTGQRDYETGQEFLFLGKNYPLYISEEDVSRAKVVFDQHGWIITVPKGLAEAERRKKIKDCLVKWYREQAGEIFAARVFHFTDVVGLEPLTIAVKTQRAVWGLCCHHRKSLSFNWLLVLAPVPVIDYVIVHELAHLSHPDHSRRFWDKVAQFLPDYQQRQDWLKNHRLEMKLP